jgi:hypothetical protein
MFPSQIKFSGIIKYLNHNHILFYVIFSELSKIFLRFYKEYGPTFRLWVMGFPEVIITDPEDVEVSCKEHSH